MSIRTSILYTYITRVRRNEKNEAELDENLISIVMVILRAVRKYIKKNITIEYKINIT